MSWVRLDVHRCDLPEDWAQYSHGAVWRCPECRKEWIVQGTTSKSFAPRRDFFARLLVGDGQE